LRVAYDVHEKEVQVRLIFVAAFHCPLLEWLAGMEGQVAERKTEGGAIDSPRQRAPCVCFFFFCNPRRRAPFTVSIRSVSDWLSFSPFSTAVLRAVCENPRRRAPFTVSDWLESSAPEETRSRCKAGEEEEDG
jgi:hypothetical protein